LFCAANGLLIVWISRRKKFLKLEVQRGEDMGLDNNVLEGAAFNVNEEDLGLEHKGHS